MQWLLYIILYNLALPACSVYPESIKLNDYPSKLKVATLNIDALERFHNYIIVMMFWID